MKKKVGIIKRLFCLLLIFLLSINSFAAIVSDNDGSAFITKSEFDALKSSFQSQIDTYNNSIDSKIDGAIASYLAGIQLATTLEITNIHEQLGGKNIKWVNLASFPQVDVSWDNYAYGIVAVSIGSSSAYVCNYKSDKLWLQDQTEPAAWNVSLKASNYPYGYHQFRINPSAPDNLCYTRLECSGDQTSTTLGSFVWKVTAASTSVYAYNSNELTREGDSSGFLNNNRFGTSPWKNYTFTDHSDGVVVPFYDKRNPSNKNSSASVVDTLDIYRIDLAKSYGMSYLGLASIKSVFSNCLTYLMCSDLEFPGVAPAGYTLNSKHKATNTTLGSGKFAFSPESGDKDTGVYKQYNMPVQIYKDIKLADLHTLSDDDTLYNGGKLCTITKPGTIKTTVDFGYDTLDASRWTKQANQRVRLAFNSTKFEDTPNTSAIVGNITIKKLNGNPVTKAFLESSDISGPTQVEFQCDAIGDIYIKAQILDPAGNVNTDYTQYAWVDIGDITEDVQN